MKVRTIADTLVTYGTLASALVLPITVLVWARSYMVSDRFLRVNEGWALVAGCNNGEVVLWAAPTHPHLRDYRHRSRDASWGWSNRQAFVRMRARETFWFLGFAHAEAYTVPWRDIPVTGKAMGFVVPLWFINLIAAILPLRLLSRNMQTSAEFLAQRTAEGVGAS